MERYTLLKKNEALMAATGSPIVLLAMGVTKDNTNGQVLGQCRFKSVAQKSIQGVEISLECLGIDKEPLTPVERFQFLDLETKPGDEFGAQTPIPLPDAQTRLFTVNICKVVYADGEVWQAVNGRFIPVEPGKPIETLGELRAAYLREVAQHTTRQKKHNTLPVSREEFWLCGCGYATPHNKSCSNCGFGLNQYERITRAGTLEKSQAAYEEEQRRQAQEQQQAQQKAQEQAAKKRAAVKRA